MKKLALMSTLVFVSTVSTAASLITIEGGASFNLNSISDDSTLMDGAFDLSSSANDGTQPYGLGMEAKNGFSTWATIELPIVPNVKLKYETLIIEGSESLTIDETILGEVYDLSGEVSSELDLSHFDIALYYGLPLPAVDVNLGLNFRSLTGGFSVEETSSGESVAVDFANGDASLIVPMLYSGVVFNIPTTDFAVSGELMTLPLGDTNISDWMIKGTWYAPLPTNMLVKAGIDVGYRSFGFTIGEETVGVDTSSYQSDVSINSFFVAGKVTF